MLPSMKTARPWRRLGLSWALGLLGALATALPSAAAENLIVTFGILQRSIPIADLERFATTGELTPQLHAYRRQLQISDEQLSQIRQVLSTPAGLSPVAVAQFLYTEQGVLLLEQIGRVVQTPVRQANVQALRGALILAAADPEGGFTLVNVLKTYPTEAMRIDLIEGLAIAQEINQAILQSEAAFNQVQAIAAAEAAANPVDADVLLQLVQSERQYGVDLIQVVVPGLPSPVQLYLPEVLPGRQGVPATGFPLVVISHGLGGTLNSYSYLAEYLATGGIAVATLEHPGSNDQQLYALLAGRSDAVVQDEEFLRRPRDVSLTLNTLARLNQSPSPIRRRLDLDRVGIIGQSFGGYTALALTGATFDRTGLATACPPGTLSFNPSLLLQCQAARLNNPGSSLGDPRVKSVFIMNPIGSALFGPTGYGQIQVPIMVVAGTADTVAPAFPEQIEPFTWLTARDRYLLLIDRGTHFSTIGDITQSDQPLTIPPELIGLNPELVWSYMQVLGLAYFKLTLEGDQRFQPALTPAFAAALGGEPYLLSLLATLTPESPQNVPARNPEPAGDSLDPLTDQPLTPLPQAGSP
ncbi:MULTISPECIES: alpha/beta hydrolase [Cyanophyceae]|uniref:alpha/beta hydrolase n=1 Tax=Cyanophyceae TaxID=3028117 RepID=UPI001689760F|nr:MULTISPECIES: alpha/beta hydrolase [Cyanophyceae]MBD1919166.1 alpha/beta hydrolase [Phormidium sp. FACHB-77]MBD2028978.1 alpha/beta hydrolase [Phormidium sp. FACHB-322]MBD2054093.1 alpha/beta hydrolase [Leptolyngbya sp. FACHB-60]